WYVQYRQRISQVDGSSPLKRVSSRSNDFSNIFEVEQCRQSFMQSVNRDRLSANSRITLTAFVEGAYLPWAKTVVTSCSSPAMKSIIGISPPPMHLFPLPPESFCETLGTLSWS